MIGPARADLSAMEAAYSVGAFEKAAGLGEADGGPAALAFAARALLADAGLTDNLIMRDQAVEKAIADSEQALESDANNVEAHLQLAIALGFKARRLGTMRAHLMGLADDARGHVEAALALAPDDPWAYAVLGGWNLEIVGRAGNAVGRAFYGATRRAGIAAYDRALALDPGNMVLQYERALALISLDPVRLKGQAEKSLAAAVTAIPTNYVERAILVRATLLDSALAQGDRASLAALVVHLRGDYESAEGFWPS